jgi:hypothetical protein
MAHNLRYFYEFKSRQDNITHRVEILEDNYLGSVKELIPSSEPLVIEYPEFDVMEVIRGCGAKLSFIYKGDENDLRNFFTSDFKKFLVRHYEGGVLNWFGYLNSEVYTEDFTDDAQITGIMVELSANNGFGLFERHTFVDATDAEIRTLYSIPQIVQKCVNDLGLPYTTLYVLSDTTQTTSVADQEAFDVLNINTTNFTDEDGNIYNLKDVLEAVLTPLGLSMIADKEKIFLMDIHSLFENDSATFVTYDLTTLAKGTYVDNTSETFDAIEYYETGQSLSYRTGINRQLIKFDPYTNTSMVNCPINNEELFEGYVPPPSPQGTDPYDWDEYTYTTHTNYDILTSSCIPKRILVEESHPDHGNEENWVLHIIPSVEANGTVSDICFQNKRRAPLSTFENTRYIGIECDFYVRRTNEYGRSTGSIRYVETKWMVKIGSKYLRRDTPNDVYSWSDTPTTASFVFGVGAGEDEVTDRWKKMEDNLYAILDKLSYWPDSKPEKFLSPTALSHGDIDVGMTPYVKTWEFNRSQGQYNPTTDTSLIISIWIRDFDLKFWDASKDVVGGFRTEFQTNNVEYDGYGDPKFKDEGDSINTICGTKFYQEDEMRGCFGYLDSGYFKYITDGAKRHTNSGRLEELLLATKLGNFQEPSVQLSMSIKSITTSNQPVRIREVLYNIPTLSGKRFLFTGGNINVRDNSITGTWTEIKSDDTL